MDADIQSLHFISEPMLIDQIIGARNKKKIQLFPRGEPWNILLLSCFLNEIDNFRRVPRRFLTLEKDQNDIVTKKFVFVHNLKEKNKIIIEVSEQITVYSSSEWLLDDWDLDSSKFLSTLRSGNRQRKKPKFQTHYFFTYDINKLSGGTIAMIQNIPVLYTGLYDYSTIFHHFTKKMIQTNCHFNDNTKFLHEYYNTFVLPRSKDVHSLNSLKQKVKGYLLLNVEKCVKRRRLAKVMHDNSEHYIINGIFISNYAKSILQNENIINGLFVDTTWKVLSSYVTSILMASVGNSGIPLAFAFGLGETKSLYNLHFNTFKNILGIDLTKYIIESDQGKAIESVCQENNIVHIYCLRHYLKSLKFNEFSYSVGILLKCVSETDYNQAKSNFIEEWKQIKDEKKIAKLNKVLNKVGLKFNKKKIEGENSDLWRRCSMLHRCEFEMPSTTNSLEASHGHLNKKVPRLNEFWSSICRLVNNLTINEKSFNQKIRHNYNHIKHCSIQKQQNMDREKMDNQKDFYNTQIDNCFCSDNKLPSQLMKVDLPCCHRIDCGAQFPPCPHFSIHLDEQFDHLECSVQPIDAEDDSLKDLDEYYSNKEFAIRIIKRYSYFKDKDKIRQFVNHSYCSENDTFFILGKPASLIQMINEGISYFTDMREHMKELKKRKQDQDDPQFND